ncbi:MAG: filamentous hemagglutinin N-terminal domain-containing protein [Leptolyngbya sp. Prado105]|nr:filamentous hemagglutinin N-terminal domain-containing protein [Leptolyngbya sp. Prado105]
MTKLNGLLLLLLGLTAQTAAAQVIPDQTLPQNSIVTDTLVTGGTRSGTTLFHSFRDFSVKGSVLFLPDADIRNIITRVTGDQRSNIDGLLAVNGTANFFLLNPNGITFGRNAQLSINGSFTASTADSITFSNGAEFSAKSPQTPPLLTVSTPIGLQFGSRPASIVNQANLNVPQQRLELSGGDILLDNGSLESLGGDISLLSTGKIELSGISSINASGGRIQIQADQVTLRDRATILSDTVGAIDGRGIEIQANQFSLYDRALVRTLTIGTGTGGNVTVRAKDTISLTGAGYEAFERNYLRAAFEQNVRSNNLESAILTGTFGTGRSGNLTIEARQLRLSQGAVIGSPTQGTGAGGDLSIRVAETIDVISSGIGTTATQLGRSGNLLIQTGSLTQDLTGIITTNTLGDGDSGNLTIDATDTVKVNRTLPGAFLGSNISTTAIQGKGNAGNLEVNARRIEVKNAGAIESASGTIVLGRIFVGSGTGGNLTLNASDEIRLEGFGLDQNFASIISTNTFGSANAGNISLNTRRLVSRGQSLIVASTFASGNGGTIHLNAAESIEVVGTPRDIFGIGTNSGKQSFQDSFKISSTGAAGDITISTPRLLLQNNGRINVDSTGSGKAGSIQIQADEIKLDNSSINAATVRGGKGNIDLRSQLILLRNGSQITTDAGNSDGGNINIRTGILTAIPQEQSIISANAGRRGGAINITAQGIFGFQRSSTSNQSRITASSNIGLDGTVRLTTFGTEPEVKPDLPTTTIDTFAQVAPTCGTVAQTNRLITTGRAGLQPSVSETVQSTPIWIDDRGQQSNKAIQASAPEITEASGWVRRTDGEIMLVSESAIRPILNPCLIPARAYLAQ